MTQEALKLALEAMESVTVECNNFHHPKKDQNHHWAKCPPVARWDKAITAIKEALADPMREVQRLGQEIEQEPVAWMSEHDVGFRKSEFGATPTVPLYTTPPQRTESLIGCVNHDCDKCKPLTHEQRQELMSKAWNKWLSNKDDGRLFAWDFSFEVEAAHGIKENT